MTSVIRNLHRARKYIELLRSGERWIDVCPATATFLPLQRGDRINIINAGSKDLELQVEVTDKRHYKSVKELLAGEDLSRCLSVGASTSSLDGGSVPVDRDVKTLKVLNTRGATLAARTFEQSGIFAIHLRVVEDMFSSFDSSHVHRVSRLEELSQIARGERTIHTRFGVMYGKTRSVCPGDRILFTYNDAKTGIDWQLTCEAVATKRYATFRELLATEGVERCVPGCGDIEQAIIACHLQHRSLSAQRIQQMEKEWGVVAIQLRPISTLQKIVAADGEEKKS